MDNAVGVSLVKLENHKAVWGYIRRNSHVTIPQISKAVGLSLPTVTRAVDYGVENGIIEECEMVGGERGRRAQTYSLCPDFVHFMLVSVLRDRLCWKVHDFLSRTVSQGEVSIDDRNILSSLNEVIDSCIAADGKIAIIAVSAMGFVNKGKIINSYYFPSLDGVPLAEYIERRTGKLAVVENDMRVVASAVLSRDAKHSEGVYVVYSFGSEVCGGGALIDGKILSGLSGPASEMSGVYSVDFEKSQFDYYSQKLRSLIYVLNPKKVFLYYSGGDITARMLIDYINKDENKHMIPDFSVRDDIVSDFFAGLSMLCLQKIMEHYKTKLF